ncbi:MAG: hypothetical protein V4557_06080 [Bacteroidota bacterium]
MARKLLYNIILIVICSSVYIGCSKGDDPTPTPPPVPPVPPVGNKTCIISGISQRNSGTKAEFGMTVLYDNNLNPVKVSIFDSVANTSLFTATLTYASADSIAIDQYQYMKMDANKRIIAFITKSDLADIPNSDNYRYEYIYNTGGYLASKNLYINGSKLPNYTTVYSYTNNLVTGCVMSAGNLKVLESTLSYDATISPKTMIYTFPDAFESYYYTATLNFGTRPAKPLMQVITKLYNPGNGTLLDTWTTNYSGYSIDSNGYLNGGTASGDLQQGMASFYGKTFFTYQCQ